MYHLVYLTTNLVNGKIYVGIHSTWNLEDGYIGTGNALKKAIKKHGRTNFKREILFYCLSKDEMVNIEERIVDSSFIKRNDVYNLQSGGMRVYEGMYGAQNGMFGRTHTDEVKAKLSELRKGKPNLSGAKGGETRRGKKRGPYKPQTKPHGNKGRKRDPEVVEKIRLQQIGRKHSEETKKKITGRPKKKPVIPD